MSVLKNLRSLSERRIKCVILLDTSSIVINAHYLFMYEKLLDLNNLYRAFELSKKSVDWKCSVQRYEANLLNNLYILRKSLENETYKQKPFYEFNINERGKHRHIKFYLIFLVLIKRILLIPNIVLL